ncbi:MAG: glycosyltransferase [Candidatus Izemoplasmatales bacterium]|nr:glycosyltransferase [Candidatus Izemoplasmatales bacterium]
MEVKAIIVTIVCDVLGIENNGTTIAAMNLIRSLKQRGHEVRVVCPDQTRKNEPGFFVVPVHNLGVLNRYVAKNGVVLAKPDRKILYSAIKDADVVHLMTPFALCIAARKIAKKLDKPLTAGFHCQAENFTNHLFLMNCRLANLITYRSFYHNLYRFCDCIHYPSQFICDLFEKTIKNTNHYVISNGVNNCFKQQATKKPAEYEERFVILFTGRYSKEKSHRVLIEAVSKSKYANKIQLIFAGDGPLKEQLIELSHKLLKNQPLFHFFTRQELINVINYADLYVHPAEIEIEAIACLEAITCGLVPVIADSERSATRHFALSNTNLFRTNDSIDLANKIDYWFEHPDERRQCSKQYVGYSSQFDHDSCMAKMEKMLFDAVKIVSQRKTNKKIIYYADELHDDFSGTHIQTSKPDSSYRYAPKGILWRLAAFLLYRFIATPIGFGMGSIGYGLRIKNKKVLRPFRKSGYFLYGNHTQTVFDAFLPTLVAFPKKTFLLANPDAVSIHGIRQMVQMLGAIPIPGTNQGMKNMVEALEKTNLDGNCIAIYPEAHIWPYYTRIRAFPANSFAFPVKFDAPCFSFTTTYQERKSIFHRKKKPRITVYVDGPFFADANLDRNQAKSQLRDKIYTSMQRNATKYNEFQYVEYRKVDIAAKQINSIIEGQA